MYQTRKRAPRTLKSPRQKEQERAILDGSDRKNVGLESAPHHPPAQLLNALLALRSRLVEPLLKFRIVRLNGSERFERVRTQDNLEAEGRD